MANEGYSPLPRFFMTPGVIHGVSSGGGWRWEVECGERELKTSNVVVLYRFIMGEEEMGMRGVASPRWPVDGSAVVS